MAYKKYVAEKLFDGKGFCPPETVLITTEDGEVEGLVPIIDAGDDIIELKGILTPGFVNAHCHLELSHLHRAVPKHTGLVTFIKNILSKRNADIATIIAAMQAAENSMRKNGIVAVGDISNNALSAQLKMEGNLHYHTFVEISGFHPNIATQRFEQGLEAYEQFIEAAKGQPKMQQTIVPHAPYSVSDDLLALINDFSFEKIISMHNQETLAEDEFFKQKTGDFTALYSFLNVDIAHFSTLNASSLVNTVPKLGKVKKILLVHNTFTDENDIDFVKKQPFETVFCLCPNANLYIENTLPNVQQLFNNQVNIVVGTDSLASNEQLCILNELRTIRKNFPHITTDILLQWATSNGAAALDIAGKVGQFKKGMQPGVVLINEGLELVKILA